MEELMLKAFAVIWLMVSLKRLANRSKYFFLSEEKLRDKIKQLTQELMDLLEKMDGMPVRFLTSIIVGIPFLITIFDLGGYFFATLYSRPEQLDRYMLLVFAIVAIIYYMIQYPGLKKFKQYIEDGLLRETMEQKVLELVEHDAKIKGVSNITSIGAVIGAAYLCFVLFFL